MIASSAFDHGNPAGIAVLMQKGAALKMRQIKISVSG
jgi:hypothetical protein